MAESVEANEAASQMLCLVCGYDAEGANLGVDSCRACAAFFRRTIQTKRLFVCQGGRTCIISSKSRVMCKRCRFEKCIAIGMLPEKVRQRACSEANVSSTTGDDLVPGPSNDVVTSISSHESSLLQHAVEAYTKMTSARVEAEWSQYPYNECDPATTIDTPTGPIRMVDLDKLSGLLLLGVPHFKTYCRTLYPHLDLIDGESKRRLFRDFILRLITIEFGYRTTRNFPDASYRQGTPTAYHNHDSLLESLHRSGDAMKIRLFDVVRNRSNGDEIRQLRVFFNRLQLDDTEVAAVAAISLWRAKGYAILSDKIRDERRRLRDSILNDLNQYYLRTRSSAESAARIGEILSMFVCMQAVLRRKHEENAMLYMLDFFDTDSFWYRFTRGQ